MSIQLAAQSLTTSTTVCEALLRDTGVALLPGTAFGMEPQQLSARLAYVDFDGVAVLDAARKSAVTTPLNEAFLQAHCAHQLEGIDALCRWAAQASSGQTKTAAAR